MRQTEKELSLTAQRRSAEEFAARHAAVVDQHYAEPCVSRTDTQRAVSNELLDATLRSGSNLQHRRASRFNCCKTLRTGKKACPGFRVRVEDLDGAVLRRSPI